MNRSLLDRQDDKEQHGQRHRVMKGHAVLGGLQVVWHSWSQCAREKLEGWAGPKREWPYSAGHGEPLSRVGDGWAVVLRCFILQLHFFTRSVEDGLEGTTGEAVAYM